MPDENNDWTKKEIDLLIAFHSKHRPTPEEKEANLKAGADKGELNAKRDYFR